MSRQYTDEERAQARARMQRLRADPEYAQRDRDAARERMRRLRSSPDCAQRGGDAAREPMPQLGADGQHADREGDTNLEGRHQLQEDPEYVQRDRDAARERMRRLRGNTIHGAIELEHNELAQSDALDTIGNRPNRRVYDSWYTLRRRALQAGEPEETILTLDQWARIVEHYGGVCLCCGEPKELTFDHVLPMSMGGTFTADNVQPLCLPCNVTKRNRHIDYRPDVGAFGQSLVVFGDPVR